jgi:23S rRNA (uracil1939-C5)-methyltransferase
MTSRNRSFSNRRRPDPVEPLQHPEVELTISDLSRGGAGVARDTEGRVVFVPMTAPGDRVRVRLVEIEKRYAQAELLEVLEASPLRVTPRCPVFSECGGCSWQHLPYEVQFKTKVSGVLHALARVEIQADSGEFERDEFPAPTPWNYRNRIQLRGEFDRDSSTTSPSVPRLGFFARGSHQLIPIERCDITRPEINAVIPELREKGAALQKDFKVEVAIDSDQQIQVAWNARHAATGFRQVFDEQNLKMKEWVSQSITRGKALLDLYGGSGNLSLAIASEMASVDCVDTSVPVLDANSDQNTEIPANFRFHKSSVLTWLLRRRPQKGADRADLNPHLPRKSVILDPPREGLGREAHEIVGALVALGADEVVAVGCDPDAWAKDVARWVRQGFRLEKIAIFDFFPQTPHVESVALLRRRS